MKVSSKRSKAFSPDGIVAPLTQRMTSPVVDLQAAQQKLVAEQSGSRLSPEDTIKVFRLGLPYIQERRELRRSKRNSLIYTRALSP
mmetsp:Transcript_10368/g.11622  ORF Transcript_10368/g.11622 Transcript_10368/m.11622 type:complete len:86 (+) Transcript_10368:422-679(+)